MGKFSNKDFVMNYLEYFENGGKKKTFTHFDGSKHEYTSYGDPYTIFGIIQDVIADFKKKNESKNVNENENKLEETTPTFGEMVSRVSRLYSLYPKYSTTLPRLHSSPWNIDDANTNLNPFQGS